MMKGVLIGLVLATTLGVSGAVEAASEPSLDRDQALRKLDSLQLVEVAIGDIDPPKTPQPQWYKNQLAAEQAAQSTPRQPAPRTGGSRVVNYTVGTRGATRSNLAEFSAQANQTLNSSRGWAQLGFVFKQVPSGGSFNLILSQASQVPTFSSGCSAEWSCRVGSSVIINDDRWSGGTVAWNSAGGGIRDYRHMVINHEVGHWLGHGHASCPAPGAYAPVMLQQSISLQGCKFNAWPLSGELWSSR